MLKFVQSVEGICSSQEVIELDMFGGVRFVGGGRMPSVRLYPNDIKSLLDTLFNQIYNSEYDKARHTAVKLLREIVKYSKTRGHDCTEFYKLFHNLDFALRTYSDGNTKKEELVAMLGKIANKIEVPTGNPLNQLEDIYNELLKNPISQDNVRHIMNTLSEILELEPYIKTLDIARQNYYALLKQEVAKYHAILTELTLKKAPSNEVISKATNQLSNVLMAIQRVITPLVKIELPKDELVKLAGRGIPVSEIAKVTGYSEEDLRIMLAQAKAEAGARETG